MIMTTYFLSVLARSNDLDIDNLSACESWRIHSLEDAYNCQRMQNNAGFPDGVNSYSLQMLKYVQSYLLPCISFFPG
jgi:hypothetical protein